MATRRSERFARPHVVPAFLPVDTPVKASPAIDFAAVLGPAVRPGKEDDVAELLAALTSARQMLFWALDRDRTTVTVDDLLTRVREYARLLRGFVKPPHSKQVQAIVVLPAPAPTTTTSKQEEDEAKTVATEAAESPADEQPQQSSIDAAAAKPTEAAAPGQQQQQQQQPQVATRVETLRHAVRFTWRDLLDVKGRDWEASDVGVEEASVLLATAQTLLSRCARDLLTDASAAQTFTTLRRVAGILAEARRLADEAESVVVPGDAEEPHPKQQQQQHKDKKKSWFSSSSSSSKKKDDADTTAPTPDDDTKEHAHAPETPTLSSSSRASADLRLSLPEAWAQLALAEAQTATLRRACAQPHIEWSLIAALCSDQVQRYGSAVAGHVDALTKAAPDAANVREWAGKRFALAFLRSHVEMKTLYFSALARYCVGAPLLEKAVAETDDASCSSALAELNAAMKFHDDAGKACSRFVAAARPIAYVDDPTVALGDSAALVKRARDRALQLDASIFHRGPDAAGPSTFPEPKSLITALPLDDYPGTSPLWTQAAWDAFDRSKLEQPSFGHSGERDCCVIA